MEKKLPRIFVNKIEKELKNNDRIFYSSNKELVDINKDIKEVEKDYLTIEQKINRIFNQSNYMYKSIIKIEFLDGTKLEKTIIGRKNKNLITIDNELINIAKIKNIET
ncbi:MAG: hypothetical protein R3Y21_01610 [Mycoplasmatota bacterium]